MAVSRNQAPGQAGQPMSTAADPLFVQVQHVLDLIRPAIKSDGGDVELVSVSQSGAVEVRFLGACVGCPSSAITLQAGIERTLKQRIPAVKTVHAVP